MSDDAKNKTPENAENGEKDAPEGSDAGAAGGTGTTRRRFVAGVGAAAVVGTTSKVASATGTLTRPLYRIHPALGIARVGNADPNQPNGYVIGPEVPGYPTLQNDGPPLTPHKDPQGNVRPVAQRFRIFEYTYINGRLTPFREVNLQCSDIQSITWTVHIANKKSSFHLENGSAGDSTSGYPLPAIGYRNPTVTNRRSLENDFGPRSISGASAGPVNINAPPPNAVPAGQSVVVDQAGNPVIGYMGQLRTDYAGRLVFLGGKGRSASSAIPPTPLTHWSNNDTWFDDPGDGPVTATVTLKDGRTFSVDCTDSVSGKPWVGSAWVMVTPPKPAAWAMGCVSLYDLAFDLGVRSLTIPPENALYDDGGPLARMRIMKASWAQGGVGAPVELPGYVPDFATEIFPMLLASYNYRWTTELVNNKMDSLMDPSLADPSAASMPARGGLWQYIREPVGAQNLPGNRDMPRLRGDDPYQGQSLAHYMFAQAGPGVTKGGDPNAPTAQDIASNIRSLPVLHTQFALYQNWAAGPNSFTPPATFPPQLPAPPVITPHGLDRAALEGCIGGAFGPGIEMGWQIRHPALWIEPFRLNPNAVSQYLDQNGNPEGTPIGPGHFSRQQAVPWQADYNACNTEGSYGWWPSARPTAVLLNPTDPLNQRVPWSRPTANKFASGSQTSTYQDMVDNWWKFGYVDRDPASGGYYEVERAAQIP